MPPKQQNKSNKRRKDAGTLVQLFERPQRTIDILADEGESKNREYVKTRTGNSQAAEQMNKKQLYYALNTDVQNLSNVMSVEKLHELAVSKYGYEHKSAGEEDREAIVQHIENYKNPDNEFLSLNEVPEELQEQFDQWLFNIKDSENIIPTRSDRRKTSMQFYFTDLDRITRVGQHLREIKAHLNPNPFMVHISFGIILQAGDRIEGKKPYQGNYANMFNSDKNGAVPIHNQADFRNLINNITADTLRERFSSPGSDIKVLAVVSMYVEVYRLQWSAGVLCK